jgi:hypothetical protein
MRGESIEASVRLKDEWAAAYRPHPEPRKGQNGAKVFALARQRSTSPPLICRLIFGGPPCALATDEAHVQSTNSAGDRTMLLSSHTFARFADDNADMQTTFTAGHCIQAANKTNARPPDDHADCRRCSSISTTRTAAMTKANVAAARNKTHGDDGPPLTEGFVGSAPTRYECHATPVRGPVARKLEGGYRAALAQRPACQNSCCMTRNRRQRDLDFGSTESAERGVGIIRVRRCRRLR